jgi:hypothetical protein
MDDLDQHTIKCLGGGFTSTYGFRRKRAERWSVKAKNGKTAKAATLEGALRKLTRGCRRR